MRKLLKCNTSRAYHELHKLTVATFGSTAIVPANLKGAHVKSILLASTILFSAMGAASAADIVATAPAGFVWTGGYVGLHAGYARSDTDFTDVDGWNERGEVFGGNNDNFIGGVQAGYNFQSGAFVYGAEIELGYLGIDDRVAQPSSSEDSFASIDGGFYAALTARAGFAADRTLFFAKGGVAYLNADVNFDDNCNTGPCGGGLVNASGDDFTGWTLGAGIEHAFTDRWTAKIEYAYYDFGKATASSEDGSWRFDNDLKTHAVKFGVNYRF